MGNIALREINYKYAAIYTHTYIYIYTYIYTYIYIYIYIYYIYIYMHVCIFYKTIEVTWKIFHTVSVGNMQM